MTDPPPPLPPLKQPPPPTLQAVALESSVGNNDIQHSDPNLEAEAMDQVSVDTFLVEPRLIPRPDTTKTSSAPPVTTIPLMEAGGSSSSHEAIELEEVNVPDLETDPEISLNEQTLHPSPIDIYESSTNNPSNEQDKAAPKLEDSNIDSVDNNHDPLSHSEKCCLTDPAPPSAPALSSKCQTTQEPELRVDNIRKDTELETQRPAYKKQRLQPPFSNLTSHIPSLPSSGPATTTPAQIAATEKNPVVLNQLQESTPWTTVVNIKKKRRRYKPSEIPERRTPELRKIKPQLLKAHHFKASDRPPPVPVLHKPIISLEEHHLLDTNT